MSHDDDAASGTKREFRRWLGQRVQVNDLLPRAMRLCENDRDVAEDLVQDSIIGMVRFLEESERPLDHGGEAGSGFDRLFNRILRCRSADIRRCPQPASSGDLAWARAPHGDCPDYRVDVADWLGTHMSLLVDARRSVRQTAEAYGISKTSAHDLARSARKKLWALWAGCLAALAPTGVRRCATHTAGSARLILGCCMSLVVAVVAIIIVSADRQTPFEFSPGVPEATLAEVAPRDPHPARRPRQLRSRPVVGARPMGGRSASRGLQHEEASSSLLIQPPLEDVLNAIGQAALNRRISVRFLQVAEKGRSHYWGGNRIASNSIGRIFVTWKDKPLGGNWKTAECQGPRILNEHSRRDPCLDGSGRLLVSISTVGGDFVRHVCRIEDPERPWKLGVPRVVLGNDGRPSEGICMRSADAGEFTILVHAEPPDHIVVACHRKVQSKVGRLEWRRRFPLVDDLAATRPADGIGCVSHADIHVDGEGRVVMAFLGQYDAEGAHRWVYLKTCSSVARASEIRNWSAPRRIVQSATATQKISVDLTNRGLLYLEEVRPGDYALRLLQWNEIDLD